MIKNVSKKNRQTEKEIEMLVGNSFSIWERFKMNGNGSPRLLISEASENIQKLMNKDNNLNYCNIEIRPKGIIVGFKSRLEVFAWCIPYYQLKVFQNQHTFTLFSATEKITIENKSRSIQNFFRKIIQQKILFLEHEQFLIS